MKNRRNGEKPSEIPAQRVDVMQMAKALEKLVDYVLALQVLAVSHGFWTIEEHHQAHVEMQKDRSILLKQGMPYDMGMKIIQAANRLKDMRGGK